MILEALLLCEKLPEYNWRNRFTSHPNLKRFEHNSGKMWDEWHVLAIPAVVLYLGYHLAEAKEALYFIWKMNFGLSY